MPCIYCTRAPAITNLLPNDVKLFWLVKFFPNKRLNSLVLLNSIVNSYVFFPQLVQKVQLPIKWTKYTVQKQISSTACIYTQCNMPYIAQHIAVDNNGCYNYIMVVMQHVMIIYTEHWIALICPLTGPGAPAITNACILYTMILVVLT